MIRGLLSLVMLGAVGGGGLYALAQQPPAVSQGLKKVQVSTEAAHSFDEKIAAMQKAVDEAKRTGKAQPVELTVTEEELTSKIAETTVSASGGIVTDAVQINLSGGNIIATTNVNVQGLSLAVGIVAAPVVEGGKTKIVVKEIQTGALPVPDAIKQQIEAQIGRAVDPSSLGLPFDISKMTIVDGKLVISGTTKP